MTRSSFMRRFTRSAVTAAIVAAASGVAVVAYPVNAGAATTGFSTTPVASWRANGVGYATLVVGSTVYVGGSFTSVTNPNGSTRVNRANVAAFDLTTGALKTAFRADTNGTIRALAYDGKNLYLGGAFTAVNGSGRSRIAAVDPVSGAVRTWWNATASWTVNSLAVQSGRLYLAGSFSWLNGVARSRIGAVNLSNGSLTSFAPAANDTVTSIAAAPNGTDVYIGGYYTSVNGVSASRLTKLTTWGRVVPMTWQYLDGLALDLEVSSDSSRLAVGVGGVGNRSAWYSTSNGTRYWQQRCDGDAQAVHVIGTQLFSGFHEGCNGDKVTRVTSHATSTGVRDTAFQPRFDRFWGVRDIAGTTSALVIAGDFTNISGRAVQGFAIFPPRR